MALTLFRDARGVAWQVCEVTRAQLEACWAREAVHQETGSRVVSRSVLPGLEEGWLSFESWREKRRLAPYPLAWRDLLSSQLAELCVRATPVPPLAPLARNHAAASLTARSPTARSPVARPPLWPSAAAARRRAGSSPGEPLDRESGDGR